MPPERSRAALQGALRGYGAQLLAHAVGRAQSLGHPAIVIEADPFAEGFYLRMGAVRVGERPSTVEPGRMLPLLRLGVPAS